MNDRPFAELVGDWFKEIAPRLILKEGERDCE
jgi:hypothetical protein